MSGKSSSKNSNSVYESVGITHIHTLYSDGSGTSSEIAQYADELGLDWLIITDHCHLEAKKRGEEGLYKNVVLLVGTELGEIEGTDHYLSYDINDVPDNQNDPETYTQYVKKNGGFGVIAHPHEKRDVFPHLPPYPWTSWHCHFDGIEIWNQLSQWVEGLNKSNQLQRFLHPLQSLTRPDPETLAVWDRINKKRPVAGFVGVDAHALKYPLFKGLLHLKVFHYKVQFKSLRTHLILDEPLVKNDIKKAESQIYSALKSGRHFGANHRQGNANGFKFYAVVNNKQRLFPISTIESGNEVEFFANSPLDADLYLLKDGKIVHKVSGKRLKFKTDEAGVWRLEAHRNNKGWIYSNPFRIIDKT